MTVNELIAQYWVELATKPDGELGIRFRVPKGKPGDIARAQIVARKPEIMAELTQRAEAAAAKAAAEQQARAGRQTALEQGARFDIHFQDGEYLSGYTAYGVDGDMLRREGLGREIRGWGCRIDAAFVAAHPDGFTLADVRAWLAPAKAEADAKAAAEDERIEAARQEAARTGSPVEVARWATGCDGRDIECSVDILTRLVQPDGSIRTTRTHTY